MLVKQLFKGIRFRHSHWFLIWKCSWTCTWLACPVDWIGHDQSCCPLSIIVKVFVFFMVQISFMSIISFDKQAVLALLVLTKHHCHTYNIYNASITFPILTWEISVSKLTRITPCEGLYGVNVLVLLAR